MFFLTVTLFYALFGLEVAKKKVELIEGLGTLLISTVTTVITGAPYLVYLLVAAWLCALIFNIVHEMAGGH